MKKNTEINLDISFIFLVLPVLFLIIGYFVYPYPSENLQTIIQIPLFLGLILLFAGFILKNKNYSQWLKISGWTVFSFYWAAQPSHLYFSEGGDLVNAVICIIGVFVLMYIAYHEWFSLKRNETISCLNWIAGASAIAGIIYFGIEKSPLAVSLIYEVAKQSGFVLDLLIGNVTVGNPGVFGTPLYYNGEYAVTIIFACTAIQSFVIFVGMIGALPKIDMKRRIIGLVITILPVYFLNLLRNAMVAFLTVKNITDFNIAHNYIAKGGSLVALIVLLLIVVKIIPEILDEIYCLVDLHKRNGPLEKFFKKITGKK